MSFGRKTVEVLSVDVNISPWFGAAYAGVALGVAVSTMRKMVGRPVLSSRGGLMKLLRSLALLVILAAVTGCNNTTAVVASSYELTAVDGRALPISSSWVDGGSTLLSGSLTLGSDGQAQRIDRFQDWSANGGGMIYEVVKQLSGPYTIASDKITARWTNLNLCNCPPNVPNDVGVIEDSRLTLTADVAARSSSVYTYRRVSN